jgi:hypothetical protein
MTLTFNKQGDVYVGEFTVTEDFNLHIERKNRGIFEVYQRGTNNGEYAFVRGGEFFHQLVIDTDFSARVYPKHIKIIVNELPKMAIVDYAK